MITKMALKKVGFLPLRLLIAFSFFVIIAPVTASGDRSQTRWPDGKKAALSLTYDDALQSHLDIAAPALNRFGLRATFYITVSSPVFTGNINEWRTLAQSGHELGNHSLFHPCLGPEDFPDRDWVTPDRNLNNYTIPRMVQELELGNAILRSVDGKAARSYAYPCGDATAGGLSYVAAIRHLFTSARSITGSPARITDAQVSLFSIPTFGAENQTANDLIELVETVKASGGYGTITFHGVGGDYLNVSQETHDAFLTYLSIQEDEIWIDTVQNISNFARAQQDGTHETDLGPG